VNPGSRETSCWILMLKASTSCLNCAHTLPLMTRASRKTIKVSSLNPVHRVLADSRILLAALWL
jgi:hypothetical protein